MHPWLGDVPLLGRPLRTGTTLLLLALIVCCMHGARRVRALDALAWRRARPAFAAVALAPWVGGHAHFLLNNWAWAAQQSAVLLNPIMGFHAGGAMIGLTLSLMVVVGHYRLPLGRIADALVPTIGLGIIIARLGCFAEGCCWGRLCRWPWAVTFPRGTPPYEVHLAQGHIDAASLVSAPVHPLQLYFAAVGLGLLMLARWRRRYNRYDGQVALIGSMIYSASAAGLELLRAGDDARVYWGPLPQLLWTALAMLAASTAALFAVERRFRSNRGACGP